jgi:hypothetical protein
VLLVLPDNSRDAALTQVLREAQEHYFAGKPLIHRCEYNGRKPVRQNRRVTHWPGNELPERATFQRGPSSDLMPGRPKRRRIGLTRKLGRIIWQPYGFSEMLRQPSLARARKQRPT